MSAEQRELDLITSKPAFSFRTKKKSLLRFFGPKYRTWYVPFSSLGVMDYQSEVFFRMKVNEGEILAGDKRQKLAESIRVVNHNAKLAAKVVAITVLASRWKIKLFSAILGAYFYWRLDSKTLHQIVQDIFQTNNYQDFTISIILMNASRVTNPKAEVVEKQD